MLKSLEGMGLIRFLLHESKLRCMPERKVIYRVLWKSSLNGCKLCCEIFAKIWFLHTLIRKKKIVREQNGLNKSCRQFYVIGGDFFLFWRNLKNVGLRAKNVLLSIVRSHFLTKMVFLQSSIIKIFYAHGNSFFHYIFLSQLANKKLF